MNNQELCNLITQYAENNELNRLSSEIAIYPRLAGMRIFDAPLIGFSSATDSLYTIVHYHLKDQKA